MILSYSDDTPSVRRCVALQFTKIISKLNREDKKDFLSNLNILASDDQGATDYYYLVVLLEYFFLLFHCQFNYI